MAIQDEEPPTHDAINSPGLLPLKRIQAAADGYSCELGSVEEEMPKEPHSLYNKLGIPTAIPFASISLSCHFDCPLKRSSFIQSTRPRTVAAAESMIQSPSVINSDNTDLSEYSALNSGNYERGWRRTGGIETSIPPPCTNHKQPNPTSGDY